MPNTPVKTLSQARLAAFFWPWPWARAGCPVFTPVLAQQAAGSSAAQSASAGGAAPSPAESAPASESAPCKRGCPRRRSQPGAGAPLSWALRNSSTAITPSFCSILLLYIQFHNHIYHHQSFIRNSHHIGTIFTRRQTVGENDSGNL